MHVYAHPSLSSREFRWVPSSPLFSLGFPCDVFRRFFQAQLSLLLEMVANHVTIDSRDSSSVHLVVFSSFPCYHYHFFTLPFFLVWIFLWSRIASTNSTCIFKLDQFAKSLFKEGLRVYLSFLTQWIYMTSRPLSPLLHIFMLNVNDYLLIPLLSIFISPLVWSVILSWHVCFLLSNFQNSLWLWSTFYNVVKYLI